MPKSLRSRRPNHRLKVKSSPAEPEEERAAILPRLFFVLLVLLAAALLTVEIRNGFRHPSVLRVSWNPPAPALVFYQKGHAAAREAWLMDEPDGSSGAPRLIHRLDLRPSMPQNKEVRWTADGAAVYTVSTSMDRQARREISWLFEFSPGQLFVADPTEAMPGRTVFVETQSALQARLRQHSGAGAVAARWFELGALGPRLFSWQTTRWERILPES